MSVFDVPESVTSTNFELMEIKAHAGAAIDLILRLRVIPLIDDTFWDMDHDEELEYHLKPVFEFLGEDTNNIVRNVFSRAFPEAHLNNGKRDFKFIDHLIDTIDKNILQQKQQ